MSKFMERVFPVVDATIALLAKTKFVVDPIAGEKYSRSTSIISSAYKRHGKILETALRESLRGSKPYGGLYLPISIFGMAVLAVEVGRCPPHPQEPFQQHSGKLESVGGCDRSLPFAPQRYHPPSFG